MRRRVAMVAITCASWLLVASATAAPFDLDELAGRYPLTSPEGAPLLRVAVLGVGESGAPQAVAARWLLPRRPRTDALHSAFERALSRRYKMRLLKGLPAEIATDAAALLAFTGGDDEIARINAALNVDAIMVMRIAMESPISDEVIIEARLMGGRTALATFVVAEKLRLEGGLEYVGWNWPAFGIYAAFLLLLLRLLPKGSGALAVHLPHDGRDENLVTTVRATHGELSVDFSRTVSRSIIDFERMPLGPYTVEVKRIHRDPETRQESWVQSESQSVDIKRGEKARLRFKFAEVEVPVEILVCDGENAVTDGRAALGVRGRPDTVRYVRASKTLIDLGQGTHTIVLGLDGQVIERDVEVGDPSKSPQLRFDIASDPPVFTDCPSAVQPYVHGDFHSAIAILKEGGFREEAMSLIVRLHHEKGETDEAAAYLEKAGRMQDDPELGAESPDPERTAEAFEKAGDHAQAAQFYRRSGDLAAAQRAFEAAGDLEGAVACAFQMGDRLAAVGLLERSEAHLAAARLALELDDIAEAVRLLQQVPLKHGEYGDACLLLAQLFLQRNEPELALQKLDEAVSLVGADSFLELREQIGLLLERKGLAEMALEAFETIHKRDGEYPGVADKIEQLRERLSELCSDPKTRGTALSRGQRPQRYEIREEIGRGALGVVHEAWDTRLARIVALKKLPESLKEHPTAARQFLREAQSVAALDHPNIATLFDADQDDQGVYFLTMELLEGQPLDKLLEQRGPLPLGEVLQMGYEIASGLQFAHEQRIVHRDIKPANLFYTSANHVKIMDFGLAKMLEQVASTTSSISPYMAPEQAQGEAIDHRVDQYALGVTLFHMLTGRVPSEQGDAPTDPRELVADASEGLSELIVQLMSKQPDERFASTGEISDRIAALVCSAL